MKQRKQAEFERERPYMKDDIWEPCEIEKTFGHDPATYPNIDLKQHYAEVQFKPGVECNPVAPAPIETPKVPEAPAPVPETPKDPAVPAKPTSDCDLGTLGNALDAGKKAADKVEKIIEPVSDTTGSAGSAGSAGTSKENE